MRSIRIAFLAFLLVSPASAFGPSWNDFRKGIQRLPGDISREGKKFGDDVSREGKKFFNDAGNALSKPFRDADNSIKENIFIAMKNHVAHRNREIGVRPARFSPTSAEARAIQPFMPANVRFENINWYFNAYVPFDMDGIAFNNNVYIDAEYAQNSRWLIELLAHETMHVIQYSREGFKGFARRYMNSVYGGFRRYPNANQVKIHNYIGFEQEANRFAKQVMSYYDDTPSLRLPQNRMQPFQNPGDLGFKVITLLELWCEEKQEASKDDIHLIMYVDGKKVDINHPKRTWKRKIPVRRMKSKESWSIDMQVTFKRDIHIIVAEIDGGKKPDLDDLFGKVHISHPSSGRVRLNGKAGLLGISEHDYTLKWK